jgi:transporter family protein
MVKCLGTCASTHNILFSRAFTGSYTIHPILGGVVLQFVAALLGTLLLAGILFNAGDEAASEIHYDRKGIFWSCAAGLAVGTAEMLSFCVSGMGVPATQSIPIIIGGSVIWGSVLGLILLGEVLMLHGWSGVLMLVTGIALVATDPGAKVEEGGGGTTDADGNPPLLVWIWPALACAMAYAFYNVRTKNHCSSFLSSRRSSLTHSHVVFADFY